MPTLMQTVFVVLVFLAIMICLRFLGVNFSTYSESKTASKSPGCPTIIMGNLEFKGPPGGSLHVNMKNGVISVNGKLLSDGLPPGVTMTEK